MSAIIPPPQHLPTEIIVKITQQAIADYLEDFAVGDSPKDIDMVRIHGSLYEIYNIALVDVARKDQVRQLVNTQKKAIKVGESKKLKRLDQTLHMMLTVQAVPGGHGNQILQLLRESMMNDVKEYADTVTRILEVLRL